MKIKGIKQILAYLSFIGLSVFLLILAISASEKSYTREVIEETVVVSEKIDPYHGLAQKIAQSENLEITQNLTEALELNPKFIILVASPENLGEEKLLNIGEIYKSLNYYPALGIISGSTKEKAEQLWMRRELAQEGMNYLGGDIEKGQSINEPTILNISEGSEEKIVLDKENLIETLEQADYFYWARHVTENKWFWNSETENYGENDKLYAKDIPGLKSIVIHTPSCGSFQPWVIDSIALGFVDKGAAAYLGHVRSPVSNAFLMRRGSLVPGIYTWKEFPLGIMAQIQNKMTVKAAHNTPLFFMFGDPRIYLSTNKPYQIKADTINENTVRTIWGESDKYGVLAVKLENGADYEHIRIKGVATASENDIFYNNNLQSLNLGEDKYILFFHQGGEFTIELLKKSPFAWGVMDTLMDAFDYSWVAIGMVYSPVSWVLLVVFILILLFKIFRQKKSIKNYRAIFLVGVLFAFLRLIYLLVRMNDYSVNASMVNYTASQIVLGFTGVFASTTGGLILIKDAKKILVKILGLFLAVSPQFLLTGFYFGFITLTNLILRINNPVSIWLWNYSAFWLPFIVALFECSFIFAMYHIIASDRKP